MLEQALAILDPRPPIRTIDWAREHGWNEDGKPYNDLLYPHLSAPGGPFDAFDCDQYFEIWLQWASRLGKTFGGQIAMLKRAACDPCPMMFASADEKVAVEVVERTYAMIDHCEPLRGHLPPPNRRKQSRIALRFSRVFVAWARSVSTLADKNIRFGHANEIDKWEHRGVGSGSAKEADPLKLFDDRFKDFPTFKKWKEGTPALKNSSRIERGRLGSCNASLFVPCGECGRFQRLKMSQILWDKTESGKSDKTTASKTARWKCDYCEQELGDEYRGPMMRGGVWIPEGCGCDDERARDAVAEWREPGRTAWGGWKESPWITGTPARDGRDYGSQLSSLYALSLSWGDIAAEFVDVQKNQQNLRNFVNQWLGETWEIASRKETWEKIGERLIDHGVQRGVVPLWASLLTAAVDRQGRDGGKFPWIVLAWGPGFRCHVVDYGECSTFPEVEAVLRRQYPHADGGKPLRPSFSLFDSGFQPLGVYEFCVRMISQGHKVWPCKGSSTAMNSDYSWSELQKGTSMPGMRLLMVDTVRSQLWLESRLFDTTEPRQTTIYNAPIGDHQDFIEQLLNDAPVDKLDSSNNAREVWQRINESLPNDYRDVWRYAWVAMLQVQGQRDVLPRRYTRPPEQAEEPSRIRSLRIRGR